MLKLLAVLSALIISAPAVAHDARGSHGGRVADAGQYHVELITKNNVIDVYLTDHNDKPVQPTGFKGLAILAVGGKSQRIVLEPAEGGKLTGKATGNLPAE
ncbi:hypothetical protein, partial [Pseudorhodoplanes sp.]|uniref:hypothetical protein n=1 Tax=Pseudorhodoplanes sp. TaxID=1934341 RepID=UPI00391A5D5F